MVLKKNVQKKTVIDNISVSGYYAIIFFLILLMIDRLSKIWALTLTRSIDYGIFAFTYVTNTGAGFSIFQNQNTLLAWIAVVALGLIIYFYNSFPKVSAILIISGIIGNLLDRVMYGYVIDFINFKFWPVFNAADAFIFIGVAITIIVEWKKTSYEEKEKINKTKKTINRTVKRTNKKSNPAKSKSRNTKNSKKVKK